ncbi:MAG TPA: methyltransferase domain-containing protein [Thermoplasmata archaeon]|nr:methyltransferase domain-containing protein [Thermoplasmata archaeon]
MRSLALIVPRAEGERIRRLLSEGDWLRKDLRIATDSDSLALPLTAVPNPGVPGGRVGEWEFDPVAPPGPRSYRDLLAPGGAGASALPRAFDVIGDVVLIRLPPGLSERHAEIGSALLQFVPGARIVGVDRGVHGTERRRSLLRIAGTGDWHTRHSENGLTMDVDLEAAYFSPRLAREHARIARLVQYGETVFDLCCGIGPFSLQIARDGRASKVVGIDLNGAAVALGLGNAKRLGLAGRVEFRHASLDEFIPVAGTADRVIFNLPREGIKYLAEVGNSVGPGGWLHYYEVTESVAKDRRPEELARVLREGSGGTWEPAQGRRVHAYSPSQELIAYALRRSP